MKNKHIFMMAACLLASLAACNKVQVLDQRKDGQIALRTTVATSTKATSLTTDILKAQGFHLAVFEGPIAETGVNKYFEMDMGNDQYKGDGYYTPYFWNDKTLHFYAWYPISENGTNGAGTLVVNEGDGYSLSYTPAVNAALQKDLAIAYNTGTKEANGSAGLNMNFRHALSQVQIVVNNGSTLADNTVIVKGVKVGNAIKSGTLSMPVITTEAAANNDNLLTSLWSGNKKTKSGDKNIQTYSIIHESPIAIARGTEQPVMGAGGNWMVVPQGLSADQVWDPEKGGAGETMYMALLVKLMQGAATVYPSAATPDEDREGDYAWTAVPIPADAMLEAGKKYTFTLTFIINTGNAGNRISDGKEILSHPIKLSVSVDDWVEINNGEILY